jgi:hypothetical protein
MPRAECESRLKDLIEHAWEHEVRWSQIEAWSRNFTGLTAPVDEEQAHGLFALSRFMYFGKRLVRELLRSLYRDHFESPLLQRIRRNYANTSDTVLLRSIYQTELSATRFIGVGNPAESGAHLLYYFRQVNRLSKNLFADVLGEFLTSADAKTGEIRYTQRDSSINRYVFFDDLVGSGSQVNQYLSAHLQRIRAGSSGLDIRFMSLFATTDGLDRLNSANLFDGKASCLFELDDSYKAFHTSGRYFSGSPSWFDVNRLQALAVTYGARLQPKRHLGYRNGQLLLGLSHNTPDNTLPIFWDEGNRVPWCPIFVRYDKKY